MNLCHWDENKKRCLTSFLNETKKNVYRFLNISQIKWHLERLNIPYKIVKCPKKSSFHRRGRYRLYIGPPEIKNRFPIKRIPLVYKKYYGIWSSHFVLGIMIYLGLVKRPLILLELDAGSNNIFTTCYQVWLNYLSSK